MSVHVRVQRSQVGQGWLEQPLLCASPSGSRRAGRSIPDSYVSRARCPCVLPARWDLAGPDRRRLVLGLAPPRRRHQARGDALGRHGELAAFLQSDVKHHEPPLPHPEFSEQRAEQSDHHRIRYRNASEGIISFSRTARQPLSTAPHSDGRDRRTRAATPSRPPPLHRKHAATPHAYTYAAVAPADVCPLSRSWTLPTQPPLRRPRASIKSGSRGRRFPPEGYGRTAPPRRWHFSAPRGTSRSGWRPARRGSATGRGGA